MLGAELRAARGSFSNKRAVMRLDRSERGDQRIAESVGVGKAGELRDALELVGLGGDGMRLLVGDHLQPVLDAAQEEIGLGQVARGFARDPASCRERSSVSSVPRRAKLRMPAAGDQLLGLREELDLADAAAAELDVVARRPRWRRDP